MQIGQGGSLRPYRVAEHFESFLQALCRTLLGGLHQLVSQAEDQGLQLTDAGQDPPSLGCVLRGEVDALVRSAEATSSGDTTVSTGPW